MNHYDTLPVNDINNLFDLPEGLDVKEVIPLSGNSNKVFRITLNDTRSVILKIASHDWSKERFENARRASKIARKNTSIILPKYLPLQENSIDKPAQAHWYVPLPTLQNLWPHLSTTKKKDVIESLGRLLRKLHKVKVERYGAFKDQERNTKTFSEFMEYDLQVRLRPAVWTYWEDALPIVDRLTEFGNSLPEKPFPNLVHNDLHLDNVLCEVENNSITCVGLLDLEASMGGKAESDIASAIELHHPIFTNLDGYLKKFAIILKEGYEKALDPDYLLFYRVYHLLNMGFYTALNHKKNQASKVKQKADKLVKMFGTNKVQT